MNLVLQMRIKKLQQRLREKNIGLALIFSLDAPNTNMIYFANYSGIGLLVVHKNKNPFLIVPEMEYEKALKTKLKVFKIDKKKRILETLTYLMRRYKLKRIGIEETKVSIYLFKKLRKAIKARYVDISDLCARIRMIKENTELRKIKKACNVADKVFNKIVNSFHFKTEQELKEFIITEMRNHNCEPAFPPVVASGKGSSQPHYDSSRKIKNGFLMIDFGAKYRYCSDMTRMLYVGKPSKNELKKYNLVLITLLECEKLVLKKKKFSELYNLAVKKFDKYSEYFTHALGHGIGLDIHELPSLYLEDKNQIQENISFTIEPGLYFPNRYGIRIEDTVVLQNNKLNILTKAKKDLVIIK